MHSTKRVGEMERRREIERESDRNKEKISLQNAPMPKHNVNIILIYCAYTIMEHIN